MDKNGLIEPLPGCAVDPTYKVLASDWQQVIKAVPLFQWRAGNVLASLEVSSRENSGEVAYTIFLEFDDFETKQTLEATNLLRDLSEGDKNGWKSTELHERKERERAELVKKLESNALLRGDTLFHRK